MRLGSFIAFITTIASMVAFINSIVAGRGIALRATADLSPTAGALTDPQTTPQTIVKDAGAKGASDR
jgi:hypothetical protein